MTDQRNEKSKRPSLSVNQRIMQQQPNDILDRPLLLKELDNGIRQEPTNRLPESLRHGANHIGSHISNRIQNSYRPFRGSDSEDNTGESSSSPSLARPIIDLGGSPQARRLKRPQPVVSSLQLQDLARNDALRVSDDASDVSLGSGSTSTGESSPAFSEPQIGVPLDLRRGMQGQQQPPPQPRRQSRGHPSLPSGPSPHTGAAQIGRSARQSVVSGGPNATPRPSGWTAQSNPGIRDSTLPSVLGSLVTNPRLLNKMSSLRSPLSPGSASGGHGFWRGLRGDPSRDSESLGGQFDTQNSVYSKTSGSIRSTIRGSTISFHNINYVVKVKRWPWSKAESKSVLTQVSGIMKPGMNAIMGPTGSGKSSLLDVLAGRKDPKYLQGHILIDGCPLPPNFKCISGYVLQDDIVMGTLTVKENLIFSAALRLSKKCTSKDREEKVQEIIEELALDRVANSKIGTEMIRGVSGGERKRTNIGIELITDPKVLFLDEPTTGLDAFTANSVMLTLRRLANRGRTIIFSIHQPKYSIYKLFDSLTLVAKGEMVYHGGANARAMNYFRELGYICEDHNNPADFYLDIVHGEIKPGNNQLNLGEDHIQHEQHQDTAEQLTKIWKQSSYFERVRAENDQILHMSPVLRNVAADRNGGSGGAGLCARCSNDAVNYHQSFGRQMLWVCWRTSLNLVRNPQASIIQLAVYLFFALSIGTVYFKIDRSMESGIQNRMGLFFFTTLQMVFVNLSAVEIFIRERQIFIHENSSGFYRTSAYFLGKIFCDMMPTKALPVILFMPMTYFMVGLRADFGAFCYFTLTLLLTTIAGCGISFFISALVEIFGIANILISITYVFMMVFGGYLINLNSMSPLLSWCRYLSIFRYCLAGLSCNEMASIEFWSVNNTRVGGADYLATQGIGTQPWDLWSNIVGLSIICVFFFSLCYLQLRFGINRYK